MVRRAVCELAPDGVCLELDEARYRALADARRFEALDLREVVKNRQLATLALRLALAGYQRSLGSKLGATPGAEMLAAARAACERGVPVHLCDRDLNVTLRRAAHASSFWQKSLLFSTLLTGLFVRPELDEDALRELRRADTLSNMLREISERLPGLARVLITERDIFLAQRIREAPGARLVAVVGAGHVAGVLQELQRETPADLAPLLATPRRASAWRWLGWAIPALIIAGLFTVGVQQGIGAARDNLLFWILANGTPTALGAALALAHPLVIAAAFASAPFTSLTPLIGVGYITGALQLWLAPPRVRELGSALEDLRTLKNLWRNRLLRLLLVFTLSTLGSLLGTLAGGAKIWSNVLAR